VENRSARNAANGLFALSVVVFLLALYVGLVFYENTINLGADTIVKVDLYTWFLVFLVVLALLFLALLVLYVRAPGRRTASSEDMSPTPFEPYTPPMQGESATPMEAEAEVMGSSQDFPSAPPLVDAEADALLVRCTNCSNEFELPYTTERPIVGNCPRCGMETVLEEDERVLAKGGDPAVEIEGIGPVYSRRLRDAGITTTEQLRAASADRLAQQIDVPRHQIEQWQGMADLVRLRGIGKQLAELLVRSGVPDSKALAKETPARLVSKVKKYLATVENAPTKARIDEKRARKLIDVARQGRLDKGKGLQ